MDENQVVLVPEGWAYGGECVARLDGKAVFVGSTIPGETVSAHVVLDRGSWARAEMLDVLVSSPDRVEPLCPAFGGCGGCQWQHVAYEAQLRAKQQIVSGQLQHLGGETDPIVRETVPSETPYAYRNRITFHVQDGRPAMFRRRSKELVGLDQCFLPIPPLQEIFGRLGDLNGVHTLTLRASVRTGEALIIINGAVPSAHERWGASVAARRRGRTVPIVGDPFMHEEVAGATFRITGSVFFQVNTSGAEHLVALVREALAPEPTDTLLDGYAGVGLFSVAVGRDAGRVIAIESGREAVDDLRHNVGDGQVEILRGRFEHVARGSWDLAVVDPPRTGLGKEGVGRVVAGRPRSIAYIACDPSALARDTRLLSSSGYRLRWAAPVDLFPQTFHIETVAAFDRR